MTIGLITKEVNVATIVGTGISDEHDFGGCPRLSFRVGRPIIKRDKILAPSQYAPAFEPIRFELHRGCEWSFMSAKIWDEIFDFKYELVDRCLRRLKKTHVPDYWRNLPPPGAADVVFDRLEAYAVPMRLYAPGFRAETRGQYCDIDIAVSDKFPEDVCSLNVDALLRHGIVLRRDQVTAFFWHEKALKVTSRDSEWGQPFAGPRIVGPPSRPVASPRLYVAQRPAGTGPVDPHPPSDEA